MTDPTILAFDTSGPFCAVALLRGGQLTTHVEDMARGQGERLMLLLEETLRDAGLSWADLDAIGVGTGPGNFTGIRIAVSAARGLALGLGIPAIGVTAFEAVTYGVPNAMACIPAPRSQAYVQSFVADGDRAPALVDVQDRARLPSVPMKADPKFCGPAARDVAMAYLGAEPSPRDLGQSAKAPIEAIATLAAQRLHSTSQPPAPSYIKPPDAAPPREQPPVILP